MKDLSQLATDVLRTVDDETTVVKQAAVSYDFKTDTGKLLVKVAELLRIDGQSRITYTDLARFRKTYGV